MSAALIIAVFVRALQLGVLLGGGLYLLKIRNVLVNLIGYLMILGGVILLSWIIVASIMFNSFLKSPAFQ